MSKRKKSNLPKISIVIPVYNTVKYIEETLYSIVSQQYPNLEIIIQDGGSTDGTVDIIKMYAKRYPKNVIWESKRDKGQLDAINKGVDKATGDIIAYINADDVYEKEAFNKVAECYLKNSGLLWMAGKGKVIDRVGNEISQFVTKYKNGLLKVNSFKILLTVNYLVQPSVFITKRAIKKYGNFKGNKDFITEYEYWLRLGKISMPRIIDFNLSSFRLSGENITSRQHKYLLKEDYLVVKQFTENPLILLLHKLHNIGRVLTIKLIQ